ncbi:MAG: hypothetical protein A3A73_01605 [Omnitrophica bacterium RIFCSPLOWO2_01_FULL_50_24]|nr:MAG: hypothetical protein A3A73_01605 [Omnitrophica bacterium RIFCSPLOWO2_01_FULL_50_24]
MKKCIICKIVGLLAGIGAINWLLVALLNFNLVTAVLGDMTIAAKAVYTLVGLSGIILLVALVKPCPCTK